jgi:hypothetical protein
MNQRMRPTPVPAAREPAVVGDHAAALPGFAEVFEHAIADLLVGQSRQNPVPERPNGFSNIMVSNALSLPLVETFNAITLPRLCQVACQNSPGLI